MVFLNCLTQPLNLLLLFALIRLLLLVRLLLLTLTNRHFLSSKTLLRRLSFCGSLRMLRLFDQRIRPATRLNCFRLCFLLAKLLRNSISVFLLRKRAFDLLDGLKRGLKDLPLNKMLQVGMDGTNTNLKTLKKSTGISFAFLELSSCGLHVLFCALSSGHNKVNWEVHAALLLGILLV